MDPTNLLNRVEILKAKVGALEELPARVDALAGQIVQLRGEMHDGFAAIRGEILAGDEETRRVLRDEIRAGDEETRHTLRGEIEAAELRLRSEIQAGDQETRGRMVELNEETRTLMRTLNDETRAQMVELNQETRTHMLVLHEDLVERISRIGEAWPAPGPTASGRSRAGSKRKRAPRRKR